MAPARPAAAPAVFVAQREERWPRIWAAVAMWFGGAVALLAGYLLPHTAAHGRLQIALLAAFATATGLFSAAVFPSRKRRPLYLLNNLFSTLGALTVFFACYWSGGATSPFALLYFFPVLYDAYFFRPRHALLHLLVNSCLALSPLLYHPGGAAANLARVLVTVAGFAGMTAALTTAKRWLLEAEREARRQALSDPLTGLYNVRGVRARARAWSGNLAVVLLDIDGFKVVNSVHGHLGADRFLAEVGSRLRAAAGPRGVVGRIGGDEFVVLGEGAAAKELEQLAARLEGAVRAAAEVLWRGSFPISASVGFASAPQDGKTLPALLAAADRRMYKRKATRDRTVVPFPARASRSEEPAPAAAVAPTPAPRGRSPARLGASCTWGSAGLAGLLVALLPSDVSPARPALLGLAGYCFLLGLAVALRRRFVALLSDATAPPTLGVALYLSGGTRSPLLPLLVVGVTFTAQFLSPRAVRSRLPFFLVVAATPFLYATNAARLAFIVPLVGLFATAVVLSWALLYARARLHAAHQRAAELAARDPLTALPNRRSFLALLEQATCPGSVGGCGPPVVAMIDLDNFKAVNDRFGHAAGDRLLKALGRELAAVTRPTDCLARIGGDEFALLARGLPPAAAQALGERVIQTVERVSRELGFGSCQVSASVGLAFPTGPLDGTLLERADRSLLGAKEAGKRSVNCLSAPA